MDKTNSRVHCAHCGKSDNSHGPDGSAYDKTHTFLSNYEAKRASRAQHKVDILIDGTWQPVKSFEHKRIAMLFVASLESWGIHARVWV